MLQESIDFHESVLAIMDESIQVGRFERCSQAVVDLWATCSPTP